MAKESPAGVEPLGRNGVQSVERAIRLLEILGASRTPQTMLTLADGLGCSPSTAHRIAVTLARAELLQFNPSTKRYSLGVGITRLAQQRGSKSDLPTVAQPFMDDLREAYRETISLWVPTTTPKDSTPAKACIACSEGSYEIRQYVQIGAVVALTDLSAGSRILLSSMPSEKVEETVRTALGGGQDASIEAVITDIRHVRAGEISRVPSEVGNLSHPDVATMATPIRDESGAIAATIVIAGPLNRFAAEQMDAAESRLRLAARQISEGLGWDPASR
ncbi:IclR family transcriptional regulator [Rhodococcus erythropolis]